MVGGGKLKYATGTATYDSNAQLVITGLDFRPYAVGVWGYTNTTYYGTGYGISDADGNSVSCSAINRKATSTVNYLSDSQYFVPNDSGFTMTMPVGTTTTFTWYAIGM